MEHVGLINIIRMRIAPHVPCSTLFLFNIIVNIYSIQERTSKKMWICGTSETNALFHQEVVF